MEPENMEPGSAEPAPTLAQEHASLLSQVRRRADAVLAEADAGRWPDAELRELLNYLRLEVLRQVVDEEWLLFRAAHHAGEQLALLRREHLELRLAVDGLARIDVERSAGAPISTAQLSAVTGDLLTQLETHLAAEEDLLSATQEVTPGVTALGGQPHEWYELTQGPVIDLDELPGARGADAALDRLLRLRAGEQIELRSGSDPSPLWQQLVRVDPGGYGVVNVERGPVRWRVQITRHPERWTPQPLA
jgi:uncharacterized protein (DUF2249 family)